MNKFYITTPIFYANANLHMGHAYTTVLCDSLARYQRLMGADTYFLTGADENTEKLVRAAKAAGKDTAQYLDDIVVNFKKLFSELEISYDQFIRTSDEKTHWPGAIEVWKRIAANGDLEKRSYKGLYCVGHEAFITEKDLVDGKCPDHGEAPQVLEEENYFFKLSKYTGLIKKAIEKGYFNITPETRKNEVMALLERGLEDVSFSRPADKMSVGIPVPGDPSQKMYVWCDALTNYISALGFGSSSDELYKKFWPADVQVIGKDILRFHGAIWPAMLISANLQLPKHLWVHGFITSGGKKMSKTLGNVIDPRKLIEEYGADAVRYYLLRHISPFEDGDLTLESFKEVYNANLANGLGNLASRILRMYMDYGVEKGDFASPEKILSSLEKPLFAYDVQSAMNSIWSEIQGLDRQIQEGQPFKVYKTDPEKAKEMVGKLVSKLYEIGVLLLPFMPTTGEKIRALILERKMPEAPLFPRKD